MTQVFEIHPSDLAHEGRPTFKKGFPDASYDVIVMKVIYRPEYQEARPGDILQFEGACYEIVETFPSATGINPEGNVDGVITFHVNHKRTIPC